MIRLFRLFLILFLTPIFLVLCLSSFLSPLLELELRQPRLVEIIQNITGHQVYLEGIEYNPFNGLFTLELRNLEIKATDINEPPILLVQTVLLGIHPLSLLFNRPEISAITLVAPQFNIVARNGQKLLDRAKGTALVSDQKMEQEFGLGLTGLTLGKISIQKGILTLIDWDQPHGSTLVVDNIHANLHALSPHRASRVSASARIRSIPFTINGHVGPLPDSLDPFEMPILLSLEAKSIGLADLNDILRGTPFEARLSKGYLTTLFHGVLGDGLQTSSWLQLDGLAFSNRGGEKKVRIVPWDMTSSKVQKFDPSPMDVAFRQKSLFRLSRDLRPTLEFEEFFVYLDGAPILETKGWVRGGLAGQLDLQFKTLSRPNLNRFPLAKGFPMDGEIPSGEVSLKGFWPESLQVQGALDLSSTAIHLPPFHKLSGVPLAVNAEVSISKGRFLIEKSHFFNPKNQKEFFDVQGLLSPSMALQARGRWELPHLSGYLPFLTSWDLGGVMDLNLVLSSLRADGRPDRASGSLVVGQGRIKKMAIEKLSMPFLWIDRDLRLGDISIHTGHGILGGLLDARLASSESRLPTTCSGYLTVAGASLERFPLFWSDGSPKLEGLVFGNLFFSGALDDSFWPDNTLRAQGRMYLKPGRMPGFDQSVFLRPPREEQTLSEPGKSFYWDQVKADVLLDYKKIQLDNLEIRSSDYRMKGHGEWRFNEKRWFDLTVNQSIHDWDPEKAFSLRLEGDDITQGFRLEPVPTNPGSH